MGLDYLALAIILQVQEQQWCPGEREFRRTLPSCIYICTDTCLSIQSILLFVGPWLVPRAISTYRSIRSRPAAQLKPLPKKTSYALTVLFLSGLIAFLSTFPYFAPENVFRIAQSRLQTSAGVLLTRLRAVRAITAFDEKLREVLDAGGLDARLLYARFGPSVLVECPFTTPGDIDAGRNYLFYATTSILLPHVLHFFALGIATSDMLSGREGARWRTVATIAGVVLAVAEAWFIANYDDKTNIRSTRLGDIDFIFWKLPVWRGIAIATFDGILGWVIWLQATGRAFLTPPPASERLLDHAKALEGMLGRVRALGVLSNGISRDADLRAHVDGYWVKEGEVMKDVFEQPEVLEAQRAALKRMDTARMEREAQQYAQGVLGGVSVPQMRH